MSNTDAQSQGDIGQPHFLNVHSIPPDVFGAVIHALSRAKGARVFGLDVAV